ncbi:hypothetical protein CVT26_016058 [Gymnopilus dilepis]|uniref:Uncharacterized protein n=1 Tax=Gymnopilus dilepis TaxID=231916 RepID=A0A409YDN3_9AGAR|nr:hypothetical protein CVT26_016058 [Gymnopilus dilepis]
MATNEYTLGRLQYCPEGCKLEDDKMCNWCFKISKVDSDIKEARCALERLIDERSTLLNQANQMRSRILHLPPELTLRIFALHIEAGHDTYVEEQHEFYNDYFARGAKRSNPKMPDCAPALTISAVCQRWREIAFATPTLWTAPVVHIYSKDKLQPQEQLLMEWFDRSADLPLKISIFRSFKPSLWDARGFTNTVLRVASRIVKLDLNLPFSFGKGFLELDGISNLEELRLNPLLHWEERERTGELELPPLPALKNLRIDRYKKYLNATVELPALVTCHLGVVDVKDIIDILRHAPNLERGMFDELYNGHFAMPSGPLLHRHLKSLDIVSQTSGTLGSLFQAVSLPSLDLLLSNSKGFQSSEIEDVFLSFLDRSQCHLQRFSLWGDSANIPQAILMRILELTPSLTTLSLSCLGSTWLFESFFRRFSPELNVGGLNNGFLPHIETIVIQTGVQDSPISWETFVVFLEVLNSRCLAFHAEDDTQSVIHASNRGHITVSVYLLGTPEQIENIIPPEMVDQLAAYQKGPLVVLKILHSESGRDLIEESLARAKKDGSVEVSL